MTDQPLVSIVVPVYNTEKYLCDCLESLLAQTEKNIEILAVDDGSSDSSPAVLRRYAANCPQIRIFTQKNAGPGAARNTALKNARGKYVMFCDSDDMFKPSMCREMAQIMENENVDFAFCDTEEYKKKVPIMIIGGCAGSFLGEYQAGGILIVLGLQEDHHPIIGNFPCTGMHGGKLFLRGDCRNLKFPPQVTADIASFEDLQGIMDDLKEYCSDFHYDLKTILSSPFTLVTPNSKNPYKQMYVAN